MKNPTLLKIRCVQHERSGYGKEDIVVKSYLETIVYYNANGKAIKEEHFLPNGELETILENEYNDQGLVTVAKQFDNDITRYELLLANLELARTQIRNTLNIFNHNLVTILGLPSNVRIEPDTNILAYSLPIESEEYWTGEANEHSPTLQQMALAVKMNTHQDKLIRAERLPTIVAVAGDHLDGPITIEVPPINKNFNYWYVGVGIKYSFSSLYKTQQAVNKSKLTLQRVKEQYDDVKEQTELAIRSDFIRYLEAYEQLSTQEKSVELAHQNYSVIHNRYQNDMALITDMLDASNSKLDAELQLANARINIIFNYYKLQKTAGNL
ncbi:TolC family protein [Bacteroidales bacterium OttesenSCG-928-B11]|nr:TolC family protein [Bacteroidales bacterium OttesenSCG-928-B11]